MEDDNDYLVKQIITTYESRGLLLDKLIILKDVCYGSQDAKCSQSVKNPISDLDTDTLLKFIHVIFHERYDCMEETTKDLKKTSEAQNLIWSEIDQIISSICKEGLTCSSIKAYQQFYLQVTNLPVIRRHLANHILLCMYHTGKQLSNLFSPIKDLIKIILTDKWSTIRKSTCSQLTPVLQFLEKDEIEELFLTLIKVCQNCSKPWQTVDGSLLGISVILNYIVKDCKIKLNDIMEAELMKVILYLMSHDQLSIRETLVQSLTIYINGCDQDKVLGIFENFLTVLEKPGENEDSAAYIRECLLNMCCSIIKCLPLRIILPKLDEYTKQIMKCLTMKASTVRQATSIVLKQLILKLDSNPVLVKYILSMLIADWTPQCCVKSDDNWEDKEGRLFVFELICEYMIKNHWLNTFGSHQPTKHGEMRRLSTSSLSTGVFTCKDLTDMNPIWTDIMLQLQDKSLLQQLYLYDQFLAQHPDKCNGIPIVLMNPVSHEYESVLNDSFHLLKDLHTSPIKDIFKTMLHQTLECLISEQWELNRIANQVLPLLSEVIRWFNINMYSQLINENITQQNTCFTYLSTYLLKEYVEHCVCLLPLLDHPPKSWKNPTKCKDAINQLIQPLHNEKERYFQSMKRVLSLKSFNKHTIMATEIILLLKNHFCIDSFMQDEDGVLEYWHTLFQFAHPSSQLCHILPTKSTTSFDSPVTGYLSCCVVKPENEIICARQVEKCLVMSVYEHLTQYLTCNQQPYFLPITAHYIGQFADDALVCKELVHCIMKTSSMIVEPVLTRSINKEMKPIYLKSLYYTLKQLAAVISIKTFDLILLEKVLSIYINISHPINPSKHLSGMFKAICARLNKGRVFTMELSPRPADSTFHNSIDNLPPSYLNTSLSLDLENITVSDTDIKANYTECLSINGSVSCNFKRRTLSLSKENHSEAKGKTEDDSDWDSWSEEEEDDDNLTHMMTDFLLKIKTSMNKESRGLFYKEVEMLKDEDREMIKSIIS